MATIEAKLISINVGRPRRMPYGNDFVMTSIFKAPVASRVLVKQLNIEGDEQSDLSVHGGPDKAVYAYPSEHYEFWKNELPDTPLPWGSFGENLTTAGLLEDDVAIGDRLSIGDTEYVVTQPRMPCFKLIIRFGRPDIVKRFMESRRNGFYLRVLREGSIVAGDSVRVTRRDAAGVSISSIVALYNDEKANEDLVRRVTELPDLPASWRDYFRKRLPQPS